MLRHFGNVLGNLYEKAIPRDKDFIMYLIVAGLVMASCIFYTGYSRPEPSIDLPFYLMAAFIGSLLWIITVPAGALYWLGRKCSKKI